MTDQLVEVKWAGPDLDIGPHVHAEPWYTSAVAGNGCPPVALHTHPLSADPQPRRWGSMATIRNDRIVRLLGYAAHASAWFAAGVGVQWVWSMYQ